MDNRALPDIDLDELFRRASLAATPEACEVCLDEITCRLQSTSLPCDTARLLMCRGSAVEPVANPRGCEDAVTAMALFEAAGAVELAIDAASLGAAHASRLGELALASELATKSILGLDSVNDDRLRWEITNRLGIFCYSFFDYERAVEQFEISLAIAERMGDKEKVCRQLHNIADTLLLASRQRQTAGFGLNADQLGRRKRRSAG